MSNNISHSAQQFFASKMGESTPVNQGFPPLVNAVAPHRTLRLGFGIQQGYRAPAGRGSPARVALPVNILDVMSDSDSESDFEEVQPPPRPSPPLHQVTPGTWQVPYCKCRRRGSKVCKSSCSCLLDSLECGQGCGCNGKCANGRVADTKLYTAASTIPGAGLGCFSRVNLAKGELVGEYRGETVSYRVANARRLRYEYLADLHYSPAHLVINGQEGGSMVTRMNHSSDNPNVVAVTRFLRVERNSRLSRSLFLKANKKISANVELFWDYGSNYPIDFA